MGQKNAKLIRREVATGKIYAECAFDVEKVKKNFKRPKLVFVLLPCVVRFFARLCISPRTAKMKVDPKNGPRKTRENFLLESFFCDLAKNACTEIFD